MQSYQIIYENGDLIAVSKLLPIPVLPDPSGDAALSGILLDDLTRRDGKAPERCEPAHRIDRPVSGIVVFAKNEETLSALTRAFRERRVEKRYLAAVSPAPKEPEATLRHLIGWNKQKARAFVSNPDPAVRGGKIRRDMKDAVLEYRTIAAGERYAIIEISMETGRHHQIRAQLASIGCPIKGDAKYGARRPNQTGLISLHSWRLTLPAEFGVPPFEAPPPAGDGVWTLRDGATAGS
jgi:23S rRNA pseudouridine1911/1915/1917 synthase